MVKLYTLAVVLGNFGFSLSDVDVLVNNKRASYGRKSGAVALLMDVDAAGAFLEEYHELRRWKR